MDIELFQSLLQLSSASGFRCYTDWKVGETDTWVLRCCRRITNHLYLLLISLRFQVAGEPTLVTWGGGGEGEGGGG